MINDFHDNLQNINTVNGVARLKSIARAAVPRKPIKIVIQTKKYLLYRQ
jgi:hypothetical protein